MTAPSTQQQEDLKALLIDLAKNGREGFANAFKNANMGKPAPTDEQFRMWFELHTNPASPNYDIDWTRALPYVEGGKQILARYERIVNPPPPEGGYDAQLAATGIPSSVTQALGANVPPPMTPPAGPMKPLAQGDAFYQPDHENAAISGVLGGQ